MNPVAKASKVGTARPLDQRQMTASANFAAGLRVGAAGGAEPRHLLEKP